MGISPFSSDATAPVEYAVAVERYLAQASLTAASRRVYRISLTGWAWPLVGKPMPTGPRRRGAMPPVVPLALFDVQDTPARLAAAVAERAEHADARTVNREISALRSALGWWRDLGWIETDPIAGLRHLTSGPAALPALTERQVAAVFGLSAGLREQVLWRLLYDSRQPADVVLAMDAAMVDLNRRVATLRQTSPAWVPGTRIGWHPETSALLAWMLSGRRWGPLFLTDRRAATGVPSNDVCPVSGKARMSYRRAEEIFTTCTRPIDPAGRGWTLHQLNRRDTPARLTS